ncbi:MAG: hypothetical protein HQL30_07765 [Candidatus Omnitrophica bacterium]|nr:hypothetical protein [Candidatus Omnitrophota bacterium]
MKILNFNDASQLNPLNDLIHDEYFSLDEVKKDGSALEIPFRRIFHYYSSPRIIKRGLLSEVGEVDCLRCVLKISNVQKYEVIDKSGIGTYSFDGAEYDPASRILRFLAHQSCEINVTISAIAVEYREIEYRGKAHIRYWIFGESNDSKVYE